MKYVPLKKVQWDVYFNWTCTNKKGKEKGFEFIILPNENTDHKHLKTKTGLILATGLLDTKLHLLSKHIQ